MIWVEGGADPSVGTITIDGATNWLAAATYALAVQGGWDGAGTKTVDPSNPTVLHARLQILNWESDVSLSDLMFVGAGGGVALEVTTSGKVSVRRVIADSNASAGAYLDNTPGTADVTLTLSQFLDNGDYGLAVFSHGTITLADVISSGNAGEGAMLNNQSAPSPKNIVLNKGVLEFNDNDDLGLGVWASGAIALKDITAVGNGDKGAYLDNDASGAYPINLTGVNIFSENGSDGLVTFSNGPIKASNVVANVNSGWGAYISNIGAPSAAAVTFTGANQFKYNGAGLFVWSNGAISGSNVTATNNDDAGAMLMNNGTGYASSVKLTGVNLFNDNSHTGLYVSSEGTITASNVTAVWNGYGVPTGYGVYLANAAAASPKAVTLSGTNTMNNNHSGGLVVMSGGAIVLSKVEASYSDDGYGAYLETMASGTASPQKVTISGYGTFDENPGGGLYIGTYGPVTVAKLHANGNGGGGAVINNYQGLALKPQPVKISGTAELNDNGDSGLLAYSLGAITVDNVSASYNGSYGAYLENTYTGAVGGVTVNGTSGFNDNGLDGLLVYSYGTITLKDFDAMENGGNGVFLSNAYAGKAGNVIVGTSRSGWCNGLFDNTYTGIEIYSYGIVTLSNMCASANGDPFAPSPRGYGVYVVNEFAASAKAVTLKGSNSFYDNYSGGLFVSSRGAITTSSLDADGNGGSGAWLSNLASTPASPQNVKLTGENFFWNNDLNGLVVMSYGTISASNVSAEENGDDGAYFDNYGALTPKPVTLSGSNSFWGNDQAGLIIYSLGNISVADVVAEENALFGARLWNDWLGATGSITLGGKDRNSFSNNGDTGLDARSNSSITAVNLGASDNGGEGAVLLNETAASNKPVSVKGGPWWSGFYGNDGYGLVIESNGPITAKDIRAGENGGVGAYLSNDTLGPSAPQNVILSGTNDFSGNGYDGLVVLTFGQVKLSNLAAHDNGWDEPSSVGAYVNNYLGAATLPRPVTLTGSSSFGGNSDGGLVVISLGAIKASNLSGYENGQDGVYLSNQFAGAAGGVTLTGYNIFNGNEVDGLKVYSHGAIAASNLTANWNGDDGAYLDTFGLAVPQKVTLTGKNLFEGNGDFGAHTGDGLTIWADGPITVSNVTASWNAEDGAYLNNYDLALTGLPGIVMSGVNTFIGNYEDGLYFSSWGSVALSKVTADSNGNDGIEGLDGWQYPACLRQPDGQWCCRLAAVELGGDHAEGRVRLRERGGQRRSDRSAGMGWGCDHPELRLDRGPHCRHLNRSGRPGGPPTSRRSQGPGSSQSHGLTLPSPRGSIPSTTE